MSSSDEITALAASCARRLPDTPSSFAQDIASLAPDVDALIAAVRDSDARFTFEREGRPGALAAIREALPAIEAELFDAVMEDVACELAAVQEALYRLALAARSKA